MRSSPGLTVFVTGGTGVLGRPVVRRLVAAGHRVRALAHSERAGAALRAQGAEPVRGSLSDPPGLRAAVAGADAVLHLATRIPPMAGANRPAAWRENDRLRAEGTRHLVDAALAGGARVFVYPSIVFVYPDNGAQWVDASRTPVDGAAPRSVVLGSTLVAEAEVERFSAAGGRGIVLRLGQLYGPEAGATQDLLAFARRGLSPLLGAPEAYFATIWVEDAAGAIVAALGADVPAGVYDVVDDTPLPRREVATALAAAVGRGRLWAVPVPLARLTAPLLAPLLARSLRVSNARFKAVSGWAPEVPDAREGLRRLGRPLNPQPARTDATRARRRVRTGLAVLVTAGLPLGAWPLLFPRSFFASFPGFGLSWVSVDGPFNEHLVRDVGSLGLALSVVALAALARTTPVLVRTLALALLAYSVPHFVYHTVHLDVLPSDLDRGLQTLTLGLMPAAALWLLWEAGRLRPANAPFPERALPERALPEQIPARHVRTAPGA